MKEQENTIEKQEELYVEVPLQDGYSIDDKEVKMLKLRNPKGRDLKGVSISDIISADVDAIALVVSRICVNEIVDRQLIRESSLADVSALVSGLLLFLDEDVSDIEDHIEEQGGKAIVQLTGSIRGQKKVSIRRPQTGDLRGHRLDSLLGRNISTIADVAKRCIQGSNIEKDDILDANMADCFLIGEALARLLEIGEAERPKLVRG